MQECVFVLEYSNSSTQFKFPQCSTLTESRSLCQEAVVSCHLVSEIGSLVDCFSLPNCYLQWFQNDNMMKSIQLYSLPSMKETSGLNCLCPPLTKSTSNCGCLMMPCGNETAASWEDLMVTLKSETFVPVLSLIYFSL